MANAAVVMVVEEVGTQLVEGPEADSPAEVVTEAEVMAVASEADLMAVASEADLMAGAFEVDIMEAGATSMGAVIGGRACTLGWADGDIPIIHTIIRDIRTTGTIRIMTATIPAHIPHSHRLANKITDTRIRPRIRGNLDHHNSRSIRRKVRMDLRRSLSLLPATIRGKTRGKTFT
jgi:hypothetical protein